MKFIFSSIIFSTVGTSAIAFECPKFPQGENLIEIESIAPKSPRAGDAVVASINLKIPASFPIALFQKIDAEIHVSTDVVGSSVFMRDINLKSTASESQLPSKVDMKFTVPQNFGGDYTVFAYLTFKSNSDLCPYQSQSIKAKIQPNADLFDISPPEILDWKTESSFYSPGDKLKILANVKDASSLCTEQLDRDGECNETHLNTIKIYLNGSTSSRVIRQPFHYRHIKGTQYEIAVPLIRTDNQQPLAPGAYLIRVEAVSDRWGNRIRSTPEIWFEVTAD